MHYSDHISKHCCVLKCDQFVIAYTIVIQNYCSNKTWITKDNGTLPQFYIQLVKMKDITVEMEK